MQSIKNSVSVKKAFIMYLLASLFLFFEMAVQVSPSVMTTQLIQDLQIGVFGLGIISGAYFYSYTAMQIPSGMLLDRFNPRLVIVSSIAACILGCALLGLSTNFFFACAARILMGFGSAFAFVSVLVVTADLFSSKYFATLTGVTQMLAAFGAMSGQLPIHILVDALGWRETMFMFAGIGGIIALMVYCFLRYERTPANQKVNEGGSTSFKDIISSKQTWYIAVYACLLWAPMSAFTSLWGVPFLIKVDHLSAGDAAFMCSLMWLGLAFASPLLGYFSTYFSNRKVALVLSSFLGFVAFGIILFFQLNIIGLIVLLFLAGAACAGQALSFTVVKENHSSKGVATAIAFNNMAVVISGAVFQPFIGWLLKFYTYQFALGIVLLAYLIGFLIALFLIKEPIKLS